MATVECNLEYIFCALQVSSIRSGYIYSQYEKFVYYWLMLDLSKLRQLVEKFLRFNALKKILISSLNKVGRFLFYQCWLWRRQRLGGGGGWVVGVRIKWGGEVVHWERLGQLRIHQSQAGHLFTERQGEIQRTGDGIYLHQGLECVVHYFVGGRNSLYSTRGVQAGVGSWKLFVWNVV